MEGSGDQMLSLMVPCSPSLSHTPSLSFPQGVRGSVRVCVFAHRWEWCVCIVMHVLQWMVLCACACNTWGGVHAEESTCLHALYFCVLHLFWVCGIFEMTHPLIFSLFLREAFN